MLVIELIDIEEISQLKARYFLHMDRKEWARWGEVFTEDATLDVSGEYPAPENPAYVVTGRDHIVAFVSAALDGVISVHHGHMPIITASAPDQASGIWAMEDNLFWADGARLVGYGHYEEEYRRVGGRWHIARLRLIRLHRTVSSPG
jgi:hypothetical protein